MAPSGLSGRLARLEARVDDLAVGHMARRLSNGSGGTVAEAEAELRAFFRVLRARYGPRWTDRDMAELIAERWGGQVAEIYARIKADRAAMRKGTPTRVQLAEGADSP